jgi:hypothetical protein
MGRIVDPNLISVPKGEGEFSRELDGYSPVIVATTVSAAPATIPALGLGSLGQEDEQGESQNRRENMAGKGRTHCN